LYKLQSCPQQQSVEALHMQRVNFLANFKILVLAGLILAGFCLPASAQVSRWLGEWPNTDFTKTSVEFSEIFSGGPPRDGIPSLPSVDFIKVGDESRLGDREPVITVEMEGQEPRAYPVRYLTWHEIANDVIGDVPVAVTFCPLCNSGLVFDRRVNGKVLSFGVSGKLRNSDMVMFDRETESWWQQIIGAGIVGEHTGTELVQLVSWMESWEEFKNRNPNGLVMDEPRAARSYGSNPYTGYDSSSRPFLFNGEMPPHNIQPLARVLKIGDRAWPLERLRDVETLEEDGFIITWSSGQTSALDSRRIAKGKNVGTIRVKDAATGADVRHDVVFAFAFHAFFPQGRWMLGG